MLFKSFKLCHSKDELLVAFPRVCLIRRAFSLVEEWRAGPNFWVRTFEKPPLELGAQQPQQTANYLRRIVDPQGGYTFTNLVPLLCFSAWIVRLVRLVWVV